MYSSARESTISGTLGTNARLTTKRNIRASARWWRAWDRGIVSTLGRICEQNWLDSQSNRGMCLGNIAIPRCQAPRAGTNAAWARTILLILNADAEAKGCPPTSTTQTGALLRTSVGLTELRAPTAKSVFQFDVQLQVAKSTHAGIPWLCYIRQQTKDRVHLWPFDGWSVPPNRSVVAEVYPALWNRTFPGAGRTADRQDAFATAEWLRRADMDGSLERVLRPEASTRYSPYSGKCDRA